MDPGNPHSSLRLLCRQGDLLLPAHSLGLGEQSAIVVGMFEAFRQQGVELNTVLIEEPEMYLHPQAQRYLRNILVELVDGGDAQIILTTHSPVFADMARFSAVRLLRKHPVLGSISTRISHPADIAFLEEELAKQKLGKYFNAESGELLFATAALLVEGHGDRLGVQEVARKMGIDLDAEGLSVIDCGGKNAIPFYARSCKALGINFVVLHDTDIYEGDELEQWQLKENETSPGQNDRIRTASGESASILTVAPNLESALGIGRSASDKPMRVLNVVLNTELSALPTGLVDAVKRLRELADAPVSEPPIFGLDPGADDVFST